MGEVDRQVVRLAADQHGVVAYRQVVGLGADRDLPLRRHDAGQWRRVATGVYLVGGAPETFEQQVMVTLLSAGPDAVASHRTAARLWGLTRARDAPIDMTLPAERRHRRRGVVVHRSGDLHLARVTRRSGIPVTGAARTLLDLGAVAPGGVRRAVFAGLRTSVVSWPLLLRTLVEHSKRGRRGVGPLRAILAEHYGEVATDSDTEDLAYEVLLDSGRVPPPHKQVPAMCADGVEVMADFGWPDHRALLEVYGADHLTNEDVQHIDLHRQNQLGLAGWNVLIYTGRLLLRQPDQFVADVEALLRRGGWAGPEISGDPSAP